MHRFPVRTAGLMRCGFAALWLAAGLAHADAAAPASKTVGTLTVQRHGDHGRPVILIPGLTCGPWEWQDTIARLEKDHVVYAVTLAGFDGVPAPADGGNLYDRADASLLQLIKQEHLDKPVLVGHSIGGSLALRFAGEHPELIAGVLAADGLPLFPGMDRVDATQRQAIAAKMGEKMAAQTPEQAKAYALAYMQKIGLVDQAAAARYAPLTMRSDHKAAAAYAEQDMAFDGRPLLKNAHMPIVEISPYYAPDFASGPLAMSEQQKADYYRSLLANAPQAKVVSISPARHFVMLDQPAKFQQALDDFLKSL